VAYNRPASLLRLLESAKNSSYKNIEVLISNNSDNQYKADYEQLASQFEFATNIWNEGNLMISAAWNKCLDLIKGELVIFCGDDYIFEKEMLSQLVDFMMSHDDCGVVGPMMYYSNNERLIPAYALSLSTGIPLLKIYKAGANLVHIVDGVIMSRTQLVKEAGGFDDKNFIFYLESADLCARLRRKGYNCYILNEAKAVHDHMPLKANILPEPDRYLNPDTYYYLMSSKIKYIRKYANIIQKCIFFIIFLPLLCLWHSSIIIIRGRKSTFLKFHSLFKGVINGVYEKL
jgi:GT2 family glycosyltransferase